MEDNRYRDRGLRWGKYRGIVTDVLDPDNMGRIKARVPSITQEYTTGWCLPCLPMVGDGHIVKFRPSVGDMVWIEFERGNVNNPVWVGCFGKAQNDIYSDYEISTVHGTLRFVDGDVHLITAGDEDNPPKEISVSFLLEEIERLENLVDTAKKDIEDWANNRFIRG